MKLEKSLADIEDHGDYLLIYAFTKAFLGKSVGIFVNQQLLGTHLSLRSQRFLVNWSPTVQ